MGERFLMFRLPAVDGAAQARKALAHAANSDSMRSTLRASVEALFAGRSWTEPRGLTDTESEQLVALTTLVVRCRSAVERDSYTREIELVPGPEAPTRLVVALSRLHAGLLALDVDDATVWKVVTKTALDSIPAIRRAAIDALEHGPAKTPEIAARIGYPTQTTRRALEDLSAHGIVRRKSGGQGHADTWWMEPWALEGYIASRTVPEMSSNAVKGESKKSATDIPGTLPQEPQAAFAASLAAHRAPPNGHTSGPRA